MMMRNAQTTWNQLEPKHNQILNRARQCAALTIPALLPPEGTTQESELPTPYQAIGAQGTNNLASKLLLALLPANQPFFRMSIDEISLAQLTDKPEEIQKNLAKIERVAQDYMETKAYRVMLFEALKMLVVSGNVLLNMTNDGKLKLFRIDSYCVKRSPTGELLEIITKENIHPEALPEKHRELVKEEGKEKEEVEIYTHIYLEDGVWSQYQQIKEQVLEDTKYTYPKDARLPWLALRWNAKPNNDYGRGHVEEYLGALRSLEGITMSIVEAAAISAKILFMIDPNGTTEEEDLTDTANGGVCAGREEDVHVLRVDKQADLQVANQLKQELTQQLSYAFLMVQAVQRDAERVTAEEMRIMVGELEDGLGGVYAVLTQDLQLPLAELVLSALTKDKKLPKLPEEIKPMITTGIEALGRGHDLNKLRTFGATLKEILGEEQGVAVLKSSNIVMMIATACGLDSNDVAKTEDELAKERSQQQQEGMVSDAVPHIAKEAAKGMNPE